MTAKTSESTWSYRRVGWLAPAGLLLSVVAGSSALGFDYGLRVAGLWSTYDGGSGKWWHFRCVELATIAELVALIFLLLTTAVALEALGRSRKWLALGWLSAPLAGGLVTLVLRQNFPSWLGIWDPFHSPNTPVGWLVHQLARAALEWALWLSLALGFAFLHWVALVVLRMARCLRNTPHEEPASVSSRTALLTVVAMTAVTGAALGSTGVAIFGLSESAVAVASGLCTALLTAILVAGCTTMPSTAGRATVACIFGAVATALLNTPLSFIVASFMGSDIRGIDEPLLGLASLTAVLGATIAAPLGLLFGLLYILPVRIAHRLCRSRAHEALDKVLNVVGSWASIVGALCLVAGLCLIHQRSFHPPTSSIPIILSALVMSIGIVTAAIGWTRQRSRRCWLQRVRDGVVDGWVLAPLKAGDELVVGLRPLLDTGEAADAVLSRRHPGRPAGAYRTGDLLIPHALV